ncbi:MAG TPA: NUDIX domain-containing protein, partial [Methylotenera sp.]|nr:NUDIX domain-containing protein [Methylotenera sp.]
AKNFLNVVANTPLVSVDLVLLSGDEILLGLRNNRPAKGFWFVPGGRILKNETINQAILRIAEKELGLSSLIKDGQLIVTFLGTYEHFYSDCFAGDNGVSTHYVVVAHKLELNKNIIVTIADEQHSELKWWKLDQALKSKVVHQYTKNYLSQGQ